MNTVLPGFKTLSNVTCDELTVLLVEDDPLVQLGCQQALQLAGLRVQVFSSAEAVMPLLTAGFAGVLITDMRLPGADGLSLVAYCRQLDPNIPAIMITGHGDVSLAVDAMRAGAYDFIPKPFSSEKLVEVTQRALEKRALTLELASLREALARREGAAVRLVGRSAQIERVRQRVAQVCNSPVDVLIHGETGTGKELVARALHELSDRRNGPLVALNCGGMPDNLLDSELFGHEAGAFTGAQKRRVGKIEYAHGGTLFLDEVETMPMAMQIKLLRVLQERCIERIGGNQSIPVDVRVIAATKEDLSQQASDSRYPFRADLYYRLNVVTLKLAPLRERREDIPVLLDHFMQLAAARYGRQPPELEADQLHQLMVYHWPGNVRELRNVAECLVLGLEQDIPGMAADSGASERSLGDAVDHFERSLIDAALRRHGGNIAATARALHVAKTTLSDKIRKYQLQGV